MTRILLISFFSASLLAAQCQDPNTRGEFASNTNGLMYSDDDMRSLRFIVDSLNLRFKSCDLDRTYYSYPQTRHYYVYFKSTNNDLKQIVEDIERNVDFHELVSRYKAYVKDLDSGRLIIRSKKEENEEGYSYLEGDPFSGYEAVHWEKDKHMKKEPVNSWTYQYIGNDQYSKNYSITARYFPKQWEREAIPTQYARLIQYADCMIDTSSKVFLTDKYRDRWQLEEKESYFNLGDLADYLDKKMTITNNNNKNLSQLSELQVEYAARELKNDIQFRTLLAKTVDDYVSHKTVNSQLEQLATKVEMYDKALLMKRNYRVMGMCSQDEAPREHARDIAILAAQAHSWDIFLRAHLDIMNDRFERMSDGSYAWGGRKTYLKELEELNLNIVDLMLGLTLRADNVSDNHYYGTVWRLGWALTESKEKDIFERKALAMMKDNSLDEFNRGLIFLLYRSYIDHLDEKETKVKIQSLNNTISEFPGFIQASIRETVKSLSEKRKRR